MIDAGSRTITIWSVVLHGKNEEATVFYGFLDDYVVLWGVIIVNYIIKFIKKYEKL